MKHVRNVVRILTLIALCAPFGAFSVTLEKMPDDPYFAKFEPVKAPATKKLILQKGDRLAIIGDSITEQKMYSRMMETYLTVCVPELEITARQFGWSGETAEGFLRRMTNDCLRFKPTVATTCYGMNDHKYRPYEEANGKWYTEKYSAVAKSLKTAGARVVVGSAGCVGKMPGWVKSATGTIEDLNLNLCKLRNIGIEIAGEQGHAFADVFWPMYNAQFNGQKLYGADFCAAGKDGVHPGWAGQTIMAYAFLKGMGLDGNLGTITVDVNGGKASATGGHKVEGVANGEVKITSSRYPYCATGATNKDDSIRAGMTLVLFNEDLNRLMLVVKGAKGAGSYEITWGPTTKTYSGEQLAKGVNLASDFEVNPFSDAFKKVDEAVYAKQGFETKQIKTIFRSPAAKADMEGTVAKTEAERAPLAAAIAAAFVPVTHTIKIVAK